MIPSTAVGVSIRFQLVLGRKPENITLRPGPGVPATAADAAFLASRGGPAPGGGGAVEFGFQFAYEGAMTPAVLGGALLWWRFYTFYLYVLLGGLSVGGTVLKALRTQRQGRLHERAARQVGSPGGPR